MRISKYVDSREKSIVPSNYFPRRDRLFDWFDEHTKRIEDDFSRSRTSLMPLDTSVSLFDPLRRRGIFDTMFYDTEDFMPRVVENRLRNTLEYHIPTGTGGAFQPEDLQVNVRGREVEVKAKREENSVDGNAYALREFRRIVRVPWNVDTSKVAAEMRKDGRIIVKAPVGQSALSNTGLLDYGSVPLRVNKVW